MLNFTALLVSPWLVLGSVATTGQTSAPALALWSQSGAAVHLPFLGKGPDVGMAGRAGPWPPGACGEGIPGRR